MMEKSSIYKWSVGSLIPLLPTRK